MSRIKYSNNLFLGRFELQRTKEFLDDDGFRKFILNNAVEFGLIDNSQDGNFTNGLVQKDTNDNTIKYNAIEAIDNNGNFLVKQATDDIGVPIGGAWYWVKITFTESNLEQGTLSLSTDGTLTGSGTEFLKTLRGVNTDFPTRIKFSNSSFNTGEYDILEVISDTSASIQGTEEPVRTFTAESDLTYQIIGTFTPGSVPSVSDKNIFVYDSCNVTLEAETVSNTPPSFTSGSEFFLARVRSVGTDVEIQDKRSSYIFKTTSNYFARNLERSTNPLIGVEAVKFDHSLSPRDKNIVEIAWGFRSENWTIDSSLNRVTLIGGQGGKYKSTNNFSNGQFDGWRIYTEDGRYGIIKQSTLSAGQINLILDSLDPDRYVDSTQQLLVVPDVDDVSIVIEADADVSTTVPTTLPNDIHTFPVNTDVAKIWTPVFEDPSYYIIRYQYRHIKDYSAVLLIPSDTDSGYLTEASFNTDGSQKTSVTRQTYTANEDTGFIILNLASNAYSNRLNSVETGDLFGYFARDLDNGEPVIDLQVGVDFNNQKINNTTITFTTEHYINLITTDAQDGNSFLIDINADITLNSQTFQIVQDYVNAGDPGTLLLDLSFDKYLNNAKIGNLYIYCIFDGVNWQVKPIVGGDIYDSGLIDGGIGTLGGSEQSNWTVSNDDYRIIGDEIHIEIFVTKTAGAANPAYILPEELWPANIVRYVSKANSTNNTASITINTSGEISIIDTSTGSIPSDGTGWNEVVSYKGANLI